MRALGFGPPLASGTRGSHRCHGSGSGADIWHLLRTSTNLFVTRWAWVLSVTTAAAVAVAVTPVAIRRRRRTNNPNKFPRIPSNRPARQGKGTKKFRTFIQQLSHRTRRTHDGFPSSPAQPVVAHGLGCFAAERLDPLESRCLGWRTCGVVPRHFFWGGVGSVTGSFVELDWTTARRTEGNRDRRSVNQSQKFGLFFFASLPAVYGVL